MWCLLASTPPPERIEGQQAEGESPGVKMRKGGWDLQPGC